MRKGFIKLFLLIGMLFVGLTTVYADDTFTFSIGGAKDVKPGDEFTVDVTVKGPTEENTLNGYNITLVYDTNELTVLEGGQMTADNLSVTENTTIAKIKFKVNDGAAAGDTMLKLEGTAYNNGEADESTFNGGTVSIRAIGTDTSLKSLKIPNTVLSPGFNKNIYDYTATVTDVTSVDIKAEPTDPHSTVWITENAQNLQKGVNEITIVVKAENGSEKWYGINIKCNSY